MREREPHLHYHSNCQMPDRLFVSLIPQRRSVRSEAVGTCFDARCSIALLGCLGALFFFTLLLDDRVPNGKPATADKHPGKRVISSPCSH